MTATTPDRAVSRPPRPLVRTFWMLHRTAHRLSGGRFGLSRPTAGERFGMLRLATVGRRSGRARVAIIGYIDDGPNLVTIAMNGWGDGEPAWWLNLQAQPDAVVGLRDGTRLVRARVATGEERDRLWATLQRTSGWGDDLDALAAMRPGQSAVVVLEPRPVDGDEIDRDVAGAAFAAATTSTSGAGASPLRATTAATPGRRWRVRMRHLWLVPGLAVAVGASELSKAYGLGLLPVIAFGIAPHLPALVGLVRPHRPGHLVPSVVPLFNLFHQPALPVIVAIVAGIGLLPPLALVGALAWLSHIIIDWALGDGPRGSDGARQPGSPLDRMIGRVRADDPATTGVGRTGAVA